MREKYITKKDILNIKRCPKLVYLDWYHKALKDPISNDQLERFEQGKQVGQFAKELYRHIAPGIDVSRGETLFGPKLVEATQAAINKDIKVLFEAGFTTTDNTRHARVDLMNNLKGTLNISEVKSSKKIKADHILDAAFQLNVIRESGIKKEINFSLVYINPEYVRKGAIIPEEYFKIKNITEEITNKQPEINKYISEVKSVLSLDTIPDVKMGKKCYSGETCMPILITLHENK